MQINGKTINPGELRTKIVLASKTISKDAGGFQAETYVFIADIYAKWVNVHGQEVWAANARGSERPATILIRYRSGLDETCVVIRDATLTPSASTYSISGGDVYEIVSMDNIQDRDEYIELKVQRMKPG